MNRSQSTSFSIFLLTFFHLTQFVNQVFFAHRPLRPKPGGEEQKIRPDYIAGWLPKLLFVLTKKRHIKLNTAESSYS
jgi:hypothetical protein